LSARLSNFLQKLHLTVFQFLVEESHSWNSLQLPGTARLGSSGEHWTGGVGDAVEGSVEGVVEGGVTVVLGVVVVVGGSTVVVTCNRRK
jgi:hypothetical protein